MLNYPDIPRAAPRPIRTVLAFDAVSLPTNPRAEGARARRAGLTADENPYLWPPGARGEWAEGFEGAQS